MAGPTSSPHVTAHPGLAKSFLMIEAKAREVLKERGLSEFEIQAELHKGKRPAQRLT
jgi:hypothetical protein